MIEKYELIFKAKELFKFVIENDTAYGLIGAQKDKSPYHYNLPCFEFRASIRQNLTNTSEYVVHAHFSSIDDSGRTFYFHPASEEKCRQILQKLVDYHKDEGFLPTLEETQDFLNKNTGGYVEDY